jgi:hypothetical protein
MGRIGETLRVHRSNVYPSAADLNHVALPSLRRTDFFGSLVFTSYRCLAYKDGTTGLHPVSIRSNASVRRILVRNDIIEVTF